MSKASEAALEAKSEYVKRHRTRLTRDADRRVDATLGEIKALIATLAAKREDLVEARHDAIWCRLYPSRSAGITTPTSIAGGRRKVLERANIQGQLQPDRLWELAVADAEHQATAITDEQAAELGMKGEDTAAVWAGTDEGREAERKEKREALERYRQEWGREPV